MCLDNFINRRESQAEIYSDNGSNFKGADGELEKALQNLDYNKMSIKFSSSTTK